MASRASSDAPVPGPSGSSGPARIPALPGLGTTWYERGARYWTRRVLSALLWLVVMAFFCFAAISLYQGFREELPGTVRTVWDWAQVVASCVAVVAGWVVQRRGHRKKLLDPPTPGQARGAKRRETGRATGLAVLGRILLVIAAPVGWVLAAFTVREYPSEVGARRALQK